MRYDLTGLMETGFSCIFPIRAGDSIQFFSRDYMCHGQGCRVFLGMGDLPPIMTESL